MYDMFLASATIQQPMHLLRHHRPLHSGRYSGKSFVVRCISCPPKVVDGVLRCCGMLYRLDKKTNWEVVRMRVADEKWQGEHLGVPHPDSSLFHPAGTKVRKNAALPAGLDVYVGGELMKGQTPKKIFNHLVGKQYDKLSVQRKRQVVGLEQSEKLVGFKFRQLQWWAMRFRHTLSNGFFIQSLCDMRVCLE